MRRLFIGLSCCLLAMGIALQAQDNEIECPDGTSYDNAVQLSVPPNVGSPLLPPEAPPDTPLPYVFTVMGLQDIKPILYVSGENNFQACAPADPRASLYSASLPTTGEVPASPLSTGFAMPPLPGSINIAVADPQGGSGEFLLFIEGASSMPTDDDGDTYALPVTAGMVASGVPLTAYVIALDENYDASLSLVDADGRVLRDETNQNITCDNAGDSEACYGAAVSLEGMFIAGFRNQRFEGKATDAMLTLPLTDAMLETGLFLRVNTGETSGEYALILHFANGTAADTSVTATLEQADDGTLTVTCADGTMINSGIRFQLPPLNAENQYRVTAIGSGEYNPGLAIFTSDDTGVCYGDTPGAETYTALLPEGNYVASNRTAQAVLPADTRYLIVGGTSEPPAGTVAVIIEGFAYAANAEATETPTVLLDPTQQFATAQAAATQTFSVLESAMTQTASAEQIFLTQTAVAAQPEATLPPDAVLESPQMMGDTFGVQVSPGMADAASSVFVYMIAAERTLNPLLAWVDDTNTVLRDAQARLVMCDDAGVPLRCQEQLPPLSGYQLTLANNLIVPGFTPDAALRLPIGEDDAGEMLRVVATTPDNTSGAYVLVVTLVTR